MMQSPATGSWGQVCSQVLANMSAYSSNIRRHEEFIPPQGFDWPRTLPSAKHRLQRNFQYFQPNYVLLLMLCAVLSLFNTKIYFPFLLAYACWLVLIVFRLFRENPPGLRTTSEKVGMSGMVSMLLLQAYFAECLGNLIMGVGIGVAAAIVHAFFRKSDDLFLSEEEAVSAGLLRPQLDSTSPSSSTPIMPP